MKKILLIFLIVVVIGILFRMFFLRDLEITGKADLSWDQSEDESVAGYKIYYGAKPRKGKCPSSGGYEKKIDAGKVTSHVISDLKNKTTYYFSVTSYNTSGKESCFSEETQKTVDLSMWEKIKALFNRK